jgi:hypothetical protein
LHLGSFEFQLGDLTCLGRFDPRPSSAGWFFLATAGLFGYADGSKWGEHCRMKAAG